MSTSSSLVITGFSDPDESAGFFYVAKNECDLVVDLLPRVPTHMPFAVAAAVYSKLAV